MKQKHDVIKIENLTKTYKIGGELTTALDGIDFNNSTR